MNTPIVTIVGRPNVGKSTLFNCLTQKRDALVIDQPGVTRDRQYGFATYQNYRFLLVDTGGLTQQHSTTSESVNDLVAEQVMHAVKESDILIFLLDIRDGLTTVDQDLAKILRPMCRNIFLAVNKTEGINTDIALSDFHGFGFNGPYAISAKRGSGIKQLMDAALKVLPSNTEENLPKKNGLYIAVLGRPNVGKSTLINKILGTQRMITADQPGTTRNSIEIPFEYDGIPYTLIDTAGVRRRAKITETVEKFSVMQTLHTLDKAQIILLVLNAQEAITDQDATLLGLITASGKALIIAINKWDGLELAERKQIKNQLDRKLSFVDYACIHFISALYGSGVGTLFVSIKKISTSIQTQLSTAKITALLQQAVSAHSLPVISGKRIKLRYAHLGGHDPLRIIVHGNQTDHLSESYKRYLSHYIRKQLGLIGTPVLIDFKQGYNPYKGRKNTLTDRQKKKRRRLMQHVK
ncbi:GTP-binding protein EngA [uncultured Candidatus Thioglobus sp.]|nr:GTP-binding protein EngA [uncultured Candidatus Thioglobus sp.]